MFIKHLTIFIMTIFKIKKELACTLILTMVATSSAPLFGSAAYADEQVNDTVIAGIIDEAKSKVGIKYVWGGQTDNGFDCSGLIHYLLKETGYTGERLNAGGLRDISSDIKVENIKPGHLVFWHDKTGKKHAKIYHVGIYIGNDTIIDSSSDHSYKVGTRSLSKLLKTASEKTRVFSIGENPHLKQYINGENLAVKVNSSKEQTSSNEGKTNVEQPNNENIMEEVAIKNPLSIAIESVLLNNKVESVEETDLEDGEVTEVEMENPVATVIKSILPGKNTETVEDNETDLEDGEVTEVEMENPVATVIKSILPGKNTETVEDNETDLEDGEVAEVEVKSPIALAVSAILPTRKEESLGVQNVNSATISRDESEETPKQDTVGAGGDEPEEEPSKGLVVVSSLEEAKELASEESKTEAKQEQKTEDKVETEQKTESNSESKEGKEDTKKDKGSEKEKASKEEIIEMIDEIAPKYGIDPALGKAVAQAESSFRGDAVSHAGAAGVIQLMPDTAREMGLTVNDKVDERFDVEKNLNAGFKYLSKVKDEVEDKLGKDDWDLALAAYNAGPTRVVNSGGIPNIKETQNYVEKINNFVEDYE